MTETTFTARKIKPPAPSWTVWLGVVPFFLFALLFFFLPSARLFVGSFTDDERAFHLRHTWPSWFEQPYILNSYWLSIQISAVTALGGGIFGFLLAYSVTVGGLPKPLRTALITFSGVASNFAGVPLAFAFVATLGRTGFITAVMKTYFHMNIYDSGFNLYSFVGLALTYMYFQFPLMVLIMAPALDGLKREWREAAENLGANTYQYWLRVASADPAALDPRIDDPAVWQRLRRLCHRLCLDRWRAADHHDPDRRADPWRRASQSGSWLCHGHGHGDHHGRFIGWLLLASGPHGKVAAMSVWRKAAQDPVLELALVCDWGQFTSSCRSMPRWISLFAWSVA